MTHWHEQDLRHRLVIALLEAIAMSKGIDHLVHISRQSHAHW